MKLRGFLLALCVPSAAHAGGLLLPGAGSVSTARAGAAVASAEDSEALALNPAGINKTDGISISLGISAFDYVMQFTRTGTYDAQTSPTAYDGSPFGTTKNSPSPPLGIGAVQPVPTFAVTANLGKYVPALRGLHASIGVFAPNAYPFRDMTNGYVFNQSGADVAPPSTRYDIMKQEAAIIYPSIAVGYHINDMFDIGVRFSAGTMSLKSTTALWGMPQNFSEDVRKDGIFTVDAKDSFVPVFAAGALIRPIPQLEIGINWESEASIHATGSAVSENGPDVTLNGTPIVIKPPDPAGARCAPGGSEGDLKACVGLSIPMNAQIGARYKFLDEHQKEKGDIEIDGGWEHWSKKCETTPEGLWKDPDCTSPSEYRVVVDGSIWLRPGGGQPDTDAVLSLHDSTVSHNLQDTYSVRVGGSYRIDMDDQGVDQVIVRGGVGYDTQAAKDGWLRADLDGAARTTIGIGASYKTKSWKVDIGGGAILEGSPTNSDELVNGSYCNPTGSVGNSGCANGGASANPVGSRQGPDPINPLLNPGSQSESPVSQGQYKAHYIFFTLGGSYYF